IAEIEVGAVYKLLNGTGRVIEDYREPFESDKYWLVRKEFILQHLEEYEVKNNTVGLLALSMVWFNHVFLGCRWASYLDLPHMIHTQ
uniref:XRN2-binding (XTBD) domain-containing protein n=1 Tax=Denticeps clupeoides TaxID=299321 RepID=A0AAY4E8L9_9TELE